MIPMPQSLSAVYVHLIFSTKNRTPWLRDADLRSELHAYLGGVSRELNCPSVIVGGVEDHVHVVARLSRTLTQSDWVKELKRVSSKWIKQRSPTLQEFRWQVGYGLFSVSSSKLEAVRDYVVRQEEHHQKLCYQDEIRAFLRQYNVQWDERHVWD